MSYPILNFTGELLNQINILINNKYTLQVIFFLFITYNYKYKKIYILFLLFILLIIYKQNNYTIALP